jgi:hypothetical protein
MCQQRCAKTVRENGNPDFATRTTKLFGMSCHNPFEAAEQRTIIAHGEAVGKAFNQPEPWVGRKK